MKAILDKVWDFLKRVNWISVLKVGVVILVLALGIQTCRVRRAEHALAADKAIIVQKDKDVQAADDKALLAQAAQKKTDEQAKKDKADANKAIAVKEIALAAEHKAKLEAQAQIKTLTGDRLAANIGFRIGEHEIAAVAAGGFTLTRPGGEKTYSLFLDGEQATRDVITARGVIDEKDKTITADAGQIAARDKTIAEENGTIKARDESIDALKQNIHDLNLARALKFWKGFAAGTVFGAAIVAGLKISGVIWK